MKIKKIISVLMLIIPVISVYSQNLKESDVPSAVKTKFSAMFPNASSPKWEMENGKYEGEFKENNIETSALFEASGTYVQTEVEIPVSSLPAGVNDYAAKNLPGKKINEAAQITSSDGTVSFEAEIGKDDYIFDASGNFLKKDFDSNDTEDDDK